MKIIADSTCDLSEEIIEKYNIGIAPLTVIIEGKEYKDKVDIMPDDFYAIIEELKEPATTAMPSPTEFLKLMKDATESGEKEILCICMSSGTSGSYQSAIIAKDYFFDESTDSSIKIHVVDSKCMSHGSGWLILKCARLMKKGATFEELIEFAENYKINVKHFLSVDDLDHLIKSGRLTNASAIIGKFLHLKPIMSMRDGKGAIVAKERGTKKVLKHYVDEFIKRCDYNITDFIIIGYTSDRIIAENLKNKIMNEAEFKGEIYIMQMGVAVGNHIGLGAVSMFFVEKDNLKDNLLVNKVNELADKKNILLEKIKKYK